MAVISQYQVVIPGQTITAALWNGMELNIINNGLIPGGIEDYSSTDGQMQTVTDPYPASAISRPTSLAGEIERIRWQLDNIIGGTYWYEDPPVDITTFKTRFDAHTHDGSANNGPTIGATGITNGAITTDKIGDAQVTTAKIADSNVTTAKIADSNVTTAKIADSNVTTAKIADANVTEAKLSASIAGGGLTGGAGTPLAINADNSTLEINLDILRVKDSGITNSKINDVATTKLTGTISTSQIGDTQVTYAKLASDVTTKLSPKLIQRSSGTLTWSTEAAGEKTGNVTITSVDTTKAYVIFNGCSSSSANDISFMGSAQLTSATNVQVRALCYDNTAASFSASVVVYFTVVEWN